MTDLGYTPDAALDTRWEVIDAIIANESGRDQWGYKAGEPFRIVQGAADSHASPGFSQIKSRFVWGVKSGRRKLVSGSFVDGDCTALKGVNLYKPDDAVQAVPIWTVGASCGTSFTQAFKSVGEYDSSYDNNGRYPKLVRVPSVVIPDSGTTAIFIERNNGNYERLAKALAAYNQGPSASYWNQYTWPELLKLRTKGCKKDRDDRFNAQCNGLKYVISDLKTEKRLPPNDTVDAFNFAEYTWKDQHTIENTAPVPDETFDFCFKYGEAQWHAGTSWDTVRDAAKDAAVTDVSKREASCP